MSPREINTPDKFSAKVFSKVWPIVSMEPLLPISALAKFIQLVGSFVNVRDVGPITYKKELETDVPKLVASASGVVVEVGPGNGNQLGRYDKKKVTKVSIFPLCMHLCSS